MKLIHDPYEDLANAIVIQAAKDYRGANAVLRRKPGSYAAKAMKLDVERFFASPWFGELTNLDPHILLSRLQEEAAL